ncbi:MAG TPA: sodium:proton antiporter [Candidatus Syntrophosphaera sp.]|nr:sodium:proton antiporter [Candidatus Syntrophosphaera sp.]
MIVLLCGILLMLAGIWTMLVKKNLIRMIIGFSILDTGIHMLIVAIGYVKNGTAPIIDAGVRLAKTAEGAKVVAEKIVDPVPSALVLTAIVIGLAVTALMLAYAIRLHKTRGSLNIDDFEEQKW